MTTSRMLFLNLPVADLPASKAFFARLGFSFDEKFTDEQAACMPLSEQAFVMLLSRERMADFIARPLADAHTTTPGTYALSADSREAVDALADEALAAGGQAAAAPQDHGFMYGRSFYDLDGHHWEVMWMDPQAVEQGPAEMAQNC